MPLLSLRFLCTNPCPTDALINRWENIIFYLADKKDPKGNGSIKTQMTQNVSVSVEGYGVIFKQENIEENASFGRVR